MVTKQNEWTNNMVKTLINFLLLFLYFHVFNLLTVVTDRYLSSSRFQPLRAYLFGFYNPNFATSFMPKVSDCANIMYYLIKLCEKNVLVKTVSPFCYLLTSAGHSPIRTTGMARNPFWSFVFERWKACTVTKRINTLPAHITV